MDTPKRQRAANPQILLKSRSLLDDALRYIDLFETEHVASIASGEVMSQNADTNPFYVFLVLSLAAFLLMFAFSREPGIVFRTDAVLRVDAEAGEVVNEATAGRVRNEMQATMLAPEFVVDAMRSADMIRGETTPQIRGVADSIAQRISLAATSYQPLGQLGHTRVTLSLVTERPEAGISLLAGLSRQAQQANSRIQTFEPFVADQSGETFLLCRPTPSQPNQSGWRKPPTQTTAIV